MGRRDGKVHVVISMASIRIMVNVRGTCMYVSAKDLPTCGFKCGDEQGVISE